MRQKIIFLDVDGTLVDYYNTIPDSAIKAVQEARKKDIWYMFAQVVVARKCQKPF